MSVRIGILGCGMITQVRHAPEYAADARAKVALVWDADPVRAKDLADRYGAEVAGSPEELWTSSRVDAVSVCTPNHLHAPQTIAALTAGKHVLCEKPMALGLDEARAMVEAARKAGKVLMIGHNQKFYPAHKAARDLVAQGALGKLLSFRTIYRHGGPEKWGVNKTASTWFFDKAKAKYGVLGDLGTHKIDVVRYLTGQEVSAVQGWIATVHKAKADGSPIDLEDEAGIRMRLESGLTGTMEVSWCHYGSQDNTTVLIGEKGVLTIRPEGPGEVIWETADGRTITQRFDGPWVPKDGSSGVIREFLSAITEDREPLASGLDGWRALEVIEAGLASAREGVWKEVRHGN